MQKTIPIAEVDEFVRLLERHDIDRVRMVVESVSRTPRDSSDPKWRTEALVESFVLALAQSGDEDFRLSQSCGVVQFPAHLPSPHPPQVQELVNKLQDACVCRGLRVTFDFWSG